MLAFASHSSGLTFHFNEAASISICFATAPASRIFFQPYLLMLLLPPVPINEESELCIISMLDQSASISSAINIGKEVQTPCPISALATDIKILSSGKMLINAFGLKPVPCEPNNLFPNGKWKAIARPDPTIDPTFKKSLRVNVFLLLIS